MASVGERRYCNTSLSCLSCDSEFGGNLNAFIDHMTDTHADDSIQCMHCGELSSSGAEYAMHFIYSHTEENGSQATSPAGDVSRCNILEGSVGIYGKTPAGF